MLSTANLDQGTMFSTYSIYFLKYMPESGICVWQNK